MDRCTALSPGMIPEASQARLAATAVAAQSGPADALVPWGPFAWTLLP